MNITADTWPTHFVCWQVAVKEGKLHIVQEGRERKFVRTVLQKTFGGASVGDRCLPGPGLSCHHSCISHTPGTWRGWLLVSPLAAVAASHDCHCPCLSRSQHLQQAAACYTAAATNPGLYCRRVLYVTERAVLAAHDGGMQLLEIAPGIDLERDVLGQMDFRPHMTDVPTIMDSRCFHA